MFSTTTKKNWLLDGKLQKKKVWSYWKKSVAQSHDNMKIFK